MDPCIVMTRPVGAARTSLKHERTYRFARASASHLQFSRSAKRLTAGIPRAVSQNSTACNLRAGPLTGARNRKVRRPGPVDVLAVWSIATCRPLSWRRQLES